MFRVNYFLIAVLLWLGSSATEGSKCDCKCGNYSICDDFNKLRGEVDVNIADRTRWSRYFTFVQNHHRTWEREDAWKEHLEVRLNETADLAVSFLASRRQIEESVQKNIERLESVQSDLSDKMK